MHTVYKKKVRGMDFIYVHLLATMHAHTLFISKKIDLAATPFQRNQPLRQRSSPAVTATSIRDMERLGYECVSLCAVPDDAYGKQIFVQFFSQERICV